MTEETTPEAAEIQEQREGFDLLDRLVKRPKRKPEVVTVYLDEERGDELGDAHDVKNELGIVVDRFRSGVLGELDLEKSKPEDQRDTEKIAALEARARELIEEIRHDSLTFTLQWIPPIAEEVLQKETLDAIGVKDLPVPDAKRDQYKKEWFARAIVATLVSLKDNSSGAVKDKLTVSEAQAIKNYLPDSQQDRIDAALGRVLYRDVLAREALDNADF